MVHQSLFLANPLKSDTGQGMAMVGSPCLLLQSEIWSVHGALTAAPGEPRGYL